MTELDRVGNSDNFNFRGEGVHCFCKSAISTSSQCEKGMFARCTMLVLLYINSKILGVR